MPVSIPVGARTDQGSFKSVADEIDGYFTEVGEKVGRNFSKELAEGMSSAEKDIQRSAEKVARSYDKVADATGKVRSEQEKYNQLQESGARNDRIVTQAERLEKARRDESRAIRQTISDLKDYEQAAERAADAAQRGLGSGIQAGFGRSVVGQFMADLRSEGESSGSMTGVLIGRAMGAGLTAGLAAATAGVAAVIGGIGYTLTKGFQRLQGIDQAEFKLKALGHSGAEVGQIMKDANTAVLDTSFSLDQAAGAAASAVAAGIKPGEDLASYLTTIGDTAAVAGTSFDEMASIFNKVTANTKAQTGELQQLADRGIPIFTWLQDAYKVSGAELSKMVSKSGVDAATFRNVITANIGGAAKEMGDSFSGAVEKMGAAIARVGAAALGTPFENAADAIGAVTDRLKSMEAWMSANQDKIIGFWTKIAEGATFAVGVIESATYVITQSLSWIVNAFGDAMGAVMKGQSFLKRMVGQTADADELSRQADGWFGLADGINAFKDSTWQAMQGTADFMGDISKWGDRAQDAAKLNQLLAGTPAKVRDDNTVEVDLPIGPGGARDELRKAGFDTIEAQGGAQLLVPLTADAEKIFKSWRDSQSDDTGPGPVRPDFVPGAPLGGADGDGKGGAKGPRLPDAPVVPYDPSVLPPGIAGMPRTAAIASVESSYIDAHQKVAEKRARLQQLEGANNATADDILKAKNDVAKAERDLQQSEMRLNEARQKQFEQMTKAGQKQVGMLGSLTSQLGDIGAQLENDFGISKGLAGIAENITKFVAGLAFAPMMGTLAAISQANPLQGGHGIVGMLGAQRMAAQGIYTNVAGGYNTGYGGVGYGASALGPAALGPRTPYGMPVGTNSGGYGGSGAQFPSWVYQLGAMFGLKPSTYPGHQEKDGLNKGIDWSGPVENMQRFAEYLATIPGAMEQVIWSNPNTGQKIGIADGQFVGPGTSQPGYYASDWGDHDNHVHTRQSFSIPMPGDMRAMGPGANWPAMAQAESGGNWQANTGNGYYGGLQILPSTWDAYGGQQYAPRADLASREQQISVAENILQGQGPGAWPNTFVPAGPRPGPAPFPTHGPSGESFVGAPKGGVPYPAGPGGEGFSGLDGLPLQGIMTATQGLDLLAPGASQAAQVGIQLTNRAIGYMGQVAGIGVGGLLDTFLPSGSPLASIGNSWVGRLASGFAGASPALPNMAGQQAPPMPGQDGGQQGQQAVQQQGDTNITVNNNRMTEDGQGRDLAFHLNAMRTGPGMR